MTSPEQVRDLATALATPAGSLAIVTKGVITATNLGGSPPTVTLQLGGNTSVSVAGVRFLNSYQRPAVNDVVTVLKQGSDLFVMGRVEPSITAAFVPNSITLYRTSWQSIPNNTWTAAQWTNTAVHSGSWSTTSTTATIPRTGLYLITFSWWWASSATGNRGWAIGYNSSDLAREFKVATNQDNTASLTILKDLSAGNTVFAAVYQNSGAALDGGGVPVGDIRGRLSIVEQQVAPVPAHERWSGE